MASVAWHSVKDRLTARLSGEGGHLQRVAARLAVQTVLLLLVMLLAVEVIVYVITQRALLQSLESSLRDRAHPPAAMMRGMFEHRHSRDDHRGPLPPPQFHDPRNSDVSVVYLDVNLRPVGDGGPSVNATLVDPHAATVALKMQHEQCCGVRPYKGRDYLVYSDVLRQNGTVIGVSQASISQSQYATTLNKLQQTLIAVAILGLLIAGMISAVLVQRALRPIRAAIQRQRDFVADAAHELRTPLAIMRTVGELGMTGASGEDQSVTIEQMLVENKHLTRLVDDLSLLARADSQAISINHAAVDLSALVADTTSELKPLAEDQGVTLVADVTRNVTVVGDVLRLRQLLLILLDNALKHTPPGGTVNVQLLPNSGRARMQVVDSGPGIDPGDLPRIFDRFYRADRARTGEGSGLGLAIGRWIVSAHGGQIQAANGPKRGAMFTVSLPLARA